MKYELAKYMAADINARNALYIPAPFSDEKFSIFVGANILTD